MKSILGFIWATNNFDDMVTDIILAQDDISELIGKELFDEIDSFYHSDEYEQEETEEEPGVPEEGDPADPEEEVRSNEIWTELVHRTQQALAFYTYHSFAPHLDLSHSDKGRKILTSEDEKPAFEWMLERDDASVLSKAHRFTERLLGFLEENKDDPGIKSFWTEKPIYQFNKRLFINSAAEFERFFPIEKSRRFFIKVTSFISEVESTRIRPALGSDLFATLKEEVASGDGISEESETLLGFIRVPLALLSMVIALERLSVEVLPEGIFQNYISPTQSLKAKNPPALEVKREVAFNLKIAADKAMISLQEYLRKVSAAESETQYTPTNQLDWNSEDNKYFRV